MTFREAMFLYWTWACIWDGIPSTSKLVTFSSSNPWLRAYADLVLRVGRQVAPLASGSPEGQHLGPSTAAAFDYK